MWSRVTAFGHNRVRPHMGFALQLGAIGLLLLGAMQIPTGYGEPSARVVAQAAGWRG